MCHLKYPNMIVSGGCDMNYYSNVADYNNYECCYDDANNGLVMNSDLTKRYVSTSYFALRNAE